MDKWQSKCYFRKWGR